MHYITSNLPKANYNVLKLQYVDKSTYLKYILGENDSLPKIIKKTS